MTIGQRIAQKRKELGLSQEDLGERLGVSRQAIYKWESDQTLPEVEKLVRLSKLFFVTVGWLLGAEEDTSSLDTIMKAPDDSRELTPRQIQMVEDIAERYIAAMPHPEVVQVDPVPLELPRHRKWPVMLVCAVLIVLAGTLGLTAALLVNLSARHGELLSQVQDLQDRFGALNGQSSAPVQTSPPVQNGLVDIHHYIFYGRKDVNLAARSITYEIRVPLAYLEPLGYPADTVYFIELEAGGKSLAEEELQFVLTSSGPAFDCENLTVTMPEQSIIKLSLWAVTPIGERVRVASLSDGSFISATYPKVTMIPDIFLNDVRRGNGTAQARNLTVTVSGDYGYETKVEQVRVGLFQDMWLVQWYEEGEPAIPEGIGFARPELTVEPGSIYCEAVVAIDEYGREIIVPGVFIMYDTDKEKWVDVGKLPWALEDWSY